VYTSDIFWYKGGLRFISLVDFAGEEISPINLRKYLTAVKFWSKKRRNRRRWRVVTVWNTRASYIPRVILIGT